MDDNDDDDGRQVMATAKMTLWGDIFICRNNIQICLKYTKINEAQHTFLLLTLD